MYREALSHCMSGVVSRWNHTYKNGFMNTRFLSWPCFISSVGRVSLPQLAETLSKETIFAWKNYCKLHKTDTPPVVVLCFENCQAIIIGKYNKNYRKWASTVPMWGKQLSHLGQAHCPKWANFVLQTAPKTLHWTDSNPLF